MIKDINSQIQEAIQTSSRINKENHIQAYLTRSTENQTFRGNLKDRQEKNVVTLNRATKDTIELLNKNNQSLKAVDNIFKVMRENTTEEKEHMTI